MLDTSFKNFILSLKVCDLKKKFLKHDCIIIVVPKKGRDRHTSGNKGTSEPRPRVGSTASQGDPTSSMSAGGLSFTGALSDFSLYIFHPYGGGGQRKLASPAYNLGKVQLSQGLCLISPSM